MGKRCKTIRGGKPCEYLASDGSCLLSETELEKCPARETKGHEERDEWMLFNMRERINEV